MRNGAIIRNFNTFSPRVWMVIVLTQAVVGLSILCFVKPLVVGLSILILSPILYVWPMFAFVIILVTVPSYGTILQFGKLDIRPNDLAIMFGIIALCFQSIRDRKILIRISEFDIFFFMFLCWALFSLFWTPSLGLGVFFFAKMLAAAVMYFVVINLIKDRKTLNQALSFWVIVGGYWALSGLFTVLFASIPAAERHTIITGTLPHLGKTVRASMFFGSPNDYAFVLSITIMITILFSLLTTRRRSRGFSWASIGIMGVVLIATFSRKSWLGVALSMCVLGMKERKLLLGFLAFFLLASTFILLAGAGKFSEAVFNRIASFFLDPEISITERAISWQVAKELFIDQPITGHGAGSFFILGPRMGSPLNIPHSFYWLLLAEYGVVGFGLFALFVTKICVGLIRLMKSAADRGQRLYCLVLLSTVASILFQSAFKTIGLTEPIFIVFFAFTSVFLRLHKPAARNTGAGWNEKSS